MSGTVHTFTTIQLGADGPLEAPYAVVVVDLDGGGRRTVRVDGDTGWLAIGARAELTGGSARPG